MKKERLVADAMLGSLARKLRVFGFDTTYFREGDDSELLALAAEQDRLLLTSDRALSERAKARRVPSVLIRGSTDGERITVLGRASKEMGISLVPGPSRCATCNSSLRRLRRADVLGQVPDGVAAGHRAFFGCPGCGRLYWKGRHWTRLRRLSATLPRR